MNATVLIGETGIGGGINERHAFTSYDTLTSFIKSRVPSLSAAQVREIVASPDTQFDMPGMINHPEQNSAYWGVQRYEITITP